MVSKVVGENFLVKLKHLCKSQGFVYEKPSVNGTCTQYMYGPAGTLLRWNLLQEWYSAVVATQESTFVVEESCLQPVPRKADVSTIGGPENIIVAEENGTSDKRFPSSQYRLQQSLSEGCLNNYLRLLELNNQRLPFCVSQIGICPAHNSSDTFLLNGMEQKGMFLQCYCPPSLGTQSFDTWQKTRLKWWRQYSQNPSNFSVSDTQSTSVGQTKVDIQYKFPWGSDMVESITNRGDLELRHMETQTGLSHQGRHGRKSVFPVIIECSTSLERAMLAYLADAFTEKPVLSKDKEDAIRTIVRINHRLAPYKIAIATSGTGGRELKEVASHVAKELRHAGIGVFDAIDSNSTLESRLTRFDELGIPLSVIMNASTLKDGIVGMRNRDTTLKEQVHLSRLKDTVLKRIMVI